MLNPDKFLIDYLLRNYFAKKLILCFIFRLFQSFPANALQGTTVAAMVKLLDNYDPKVTVKETISKVEEKEKNDFLNAVMNTQVMATTEKFLKSKGNNRILIIICSNRFFHNNNLITKF